jgi:hypothetical protein
LSGKKEGAKELVRFEYSYDPTFEEYYVTGARGGIQNIYHLRLEFYSEKTRLRSMKDKLIEYQDGRREIKPEESKDSIDVVDRIFKLGLVMPFNAVRELSSFLNQKVKEIEEMERKLAVELKKNGDKGGT